MVDRRTVAAVYDRLNELRWRGLFPSLHHRKEGWLRHQENIAKPPKLTQPGWFSFYSLGKPPRPRYQRMLRGILLIARPPLLAVMKGGEYARSTLPAKALHQRECFPSQTLGELTGRDFQAQWRRLSCPKR